MFPKAPKTVAAKRTNFSFHRDGRDEKNLFDPSERVDKKTKQNHKKGDRELL
jgi:hypothetical protein